MHVEAIGAFIDLRDSQIDQIDQHSGRAALHDVAVDAAQRLHACRCDLIVVETLLISCSLLIGFYFTGVVSSLSSVSTTNTASSFAGFVLLALRLTGWREPGVS